MRRLIAMYPDGSLRWERSFAGQLSGEPRFEQVGDSVYMVFEHRNSAGGQLDIYFIDIEAAELSQVFNSGSRS